MILLALLTQPLTAQFKDRRNSETERQRSYYPPGVIYDLDYSLKVRDNFYLVQAANNGDPVAQQELALRYLAGNGFTADTAASLLWMNRSAEQGYMIANYNLAIFLYNGVGGVWNPFRSFTEFRRAARLGMPEAEFALGILYSENLVVPRDMRLSCLWVKKAADQGYAPALELLTEYTRKGITPGGTEATTVPPTVAPGSYNSSASTALQYIDFNADTATVITDSMVFTGAMKEFRKSDDGSYHGDTLRAFLLAHLDTLEAMAATGCPEVLLLLGTMTEAGIHYKRNRINAAAYYLRAFRAESPFGGRKFWDLINSPKFMAELEKQTTAANAVAEFVWSGIAALQIDQRVTKEDAFALLKKSADRNYVPAIIEAGRCYLLGNPVQKEIATAFTFWKKAAALGSREARIQYLFAGIFTDTALVTNAELLELEEGEAQGSLAAQSALAYCYETGNGTAIDYARAAMLYRKAAARGSKGSYRALLRMYNSLRPKEEEFRITE